MGEAQSGAALTRRVEEMVSGLEATLAVGETIRAEIDAVLGADDGALPILSIDAAGEPGAPRTSSPGSKDTPDLQLLGLLGQGGMGAVYAARQRALARDVAVKRPLASDATPETRAALLGEARTMGALEHPNIVPVHALGCDRAGQPLFVMKRIEGVSWRDLLRDAAHPMWGRLGTARDRGLGFHVEVLLAVSNALDFAHSRGVVHRDVKPENVMLGAFGEVYLLDWGIARKIGVGGSAAIVGTPTLHGARDAPRPGVGRRAHRRLPPRRDAPRAPRREAAPRRRDAARGLPRDPRGRALHLPGRGAGRSRRARARRVDHFIDVEDVGGVLLRSRHRPLGRSRVRGRSRDALRPGSGRRRLRRDRRRLRRHARRGLPPGDRLHRALVLGSRLPGLRRAARLRRRDACNGTSGTGSTDRPRRSRAGARGSPTTPTGTRTTTRAAGGSGPPATGRIVRAPKRRRSCASAPPTSAADGRSTSTGTMAAPANSSIAAQATSSPSSSRTAERSSQSAEQLTFSGFFWSTVAPNLDITAPEVSL